MRIVVAGQKSFGAAVLDRLEADGRNIVGVIAPVGDRLGTEAARKGHETAEKPTAALMRAMRADVLVAAHSHAFVGRATRAALRIGAVGYHPSLLPRHRGRDAVRWTVHMRDPIAGGSVYWLTDHVDGGPIAAQDWCHVDPRWSASELWSERLFPMGVELVSRVVSDLANGVMVMAPQEEFAATWEPSWDRPPVFRPELVEIGPMPEGIREVRVTA